MSVKTIPPGTRFGKLEVVGEAPPKVGKDGGHRSVSLCRCDCGNRKTVTSSNLISGGTISCGCSKLERIKTHGRTGSGIYNTWGNMIQRCNNVGSPAYLDWGGRGIAICDRWLKFECFLDDMGERPPNTSLDRIDNSLGYSKENCRWATRTEQNRNSRHNRVVTVFGVTGCVSELCERFHLRHKPILKRIERGWSLERAFTEPIHRKLWLLSL